METHLQEKVPDRVAGRVLLRQAARSEYQRELLALRDYNTLLPFEQVAALLRPLDRPELIAQAAGAELGQAASKHYPVLVNHDHDEDEERHESNEEEDEEAETEQTNEEESEELAEGEVVVEDREYQEDEAQYIQAYHSAYADVRAQLRDARKQRGFVKPRPRTPSTSGAGRSSDRGYRGQRRDGRSRPKGDSSRHNKFRSNSKPRTPKSDMVKGTAEDLVARTRCFNCQELGHLARNCPLKGGGKGAPKRSFVVCRGNGDTIGGPIFLGLFFFFWFLGLFFFLGRFSWFFLRKPPFPPYF